MTNIAVISVALAAVCFCVMHIVSRVIEYKRDKDKDAKIAEIRKELNHEILNGGNVARIYALHKRLRELANS